jgi:hypothetical protein
MLDKQTSHEGRLDRLKRIQRIEAPPIWKVAISPDSEFAAYITVHPSKESGHGTIVIARLTDILSNSDDR